jgi:hypothetical protein
LFVEDTNYYRYDLAGYYISGAFCLLGLLIGVKAVKVPYLLHDVVCVHIIFVSLFILGGLQHDEGIGDVLIKLTQYCIVLSSWGPTASRNDPKCGCFASRP